VASRRCKPRMQLLLEESMSQISSNDTASNWINHERISHRAYEIYLERGGGPGSETEDWLQAERELRQQNPQRSQAVEHTALHKEGRGVSDNPAKEPRARNARAGA